jgi:NTP pyrophosphatase (non-canonical NTP hydrolase)
MPTFGEWLASTERLQREEFAIDVPEYDPEGTIAAAIGNEKRREYIESNLLGLMVEAGEVANEFGWKPWKSGKGNVNRAKALEELVDVMHFIANLLVLLKVDGPELSAAYASKQAENVRRQREGY